MIIARNDEGSTTKTRITCTIKNAVKIHTDARIWAGRVNGGITQELAPGRHAWVQVTRGSIELNGKKLAAGDGAAVSDESKLELKASEPAEALLFDLA